MCKSKLTITLIANILLTGCFSVRSHLADKTHLQLTDDFPVCDSRHQRTCKPEAPGNWSLNLDFDNGNNFTNETLDQITAHLRRRYLGTPHYASMIDITCKPDNYNIYPNNPSITSIDLASALNKETVDDFIAKLKVKLSISESLSKSGISASVLSDLRTQLQSILQQKVRVQYYWIYLDWHGAGMTGIAKAPELTPCISEARKQKDGKIITGIAGILFWSNESETTLDSSLAFNTLLSIAGEGSIPSNKIADLKAAVELSWKHTFSKKFTIRGSLKSITKKFQPIWIRLESPP